MNKISVLLIEDTNDIRFLMKAGLERDGYHVVECINAASAMQELKKGFKPHVILLDLMLPDENGLNLIPFIRKITSAPIIIVTAKSDLVEKVIGLEAGADDYVIKPFELQELLARVKAHARRYIKLDIKAGQPKKRKNIRFGKWTLDVGRLQVFDEVGKSVQLTLGEFHLLEILISRPGQVFSRDQLLDKTREDDFDIGDRAIDTQVARIRRKLNKNSSDDSSDVVQSMRGAGYFYTGTIEIVEE